MIWLIVIAAWLVLSLPLALLVGAFIAVGDPSGDRTREREMERFLAEILS